ncbi:MAG: hypothetical protein OXG65_10485 [Chloroflexi bacterium]|nr:hypothetical protein [Chloroflexota bacterium]
MGKAPPERPAHPLAAALGVAGIGPTAIHRADGALVGALEIETRHIALSDEPRVRDAVAALTQVLTTLPGPVQLLVRNRAFDPARHLAEMARHWSRNWAGARAPRVGHLDIPRHVPTAVGLPPVTYADAVAAAHASARLRLVRCVVVLAQAPRRERWWTRGPRRLDRRAQVREWDAALQRLGAQLARAGWSSRRLREVELHDLVEGTFGPNPTPRTAVRHAVTSQRRGDAARHRMASSASAVGFDNTDSLPEWIRCHRDHLVVQGPGATTRRVSILALGGYPPHVEAGWLSWVATCPYDLDLALFVTPVEGLAPWPTAAVTGPPDEPDLDPAVARAFGHPVRVAVVLGIGADTRASLQQATQHVAADLGTRCLRVGHGLVRQLDGLRSLLPLAENRLAGWRRLPAGPVAAALPLHAPGRHDPGGFLVGTDRGTDYGRAPVIVNPAAGPASQRHLAVLGRHGPEVARCLGSLALGLWLQGANLVILDLRGTFGPLARACGGRVARPTTGRGQAINVWDVAGITDRRGFARSVQGLQRFWRLALPGLSDAQAAIVDAAVPPTYRGRGINPADPATYDSRPPTTADFVRAITAFHGMDATHGGAARAVVERLRRLTQGPLAGVFDARTTVALDSPCTVVDLRDPRAQPPALPRLVAHAILQQLATRPPQAPRGRVVVIDEVWPLLHAEPSAALLEELATSSDTASTTILMGSQHVTDVVEHRRAAPILAACAMVLLLRQELRDERRLRDAFDLRHPDLDALEQLRQDHALAILADGDRLALTVADVGLRPLNDPDLGSRRGGAAAVA